MQINRVPLTAAESDFHQKLFEGLVRDRGILGGAIRPHELNLLVEIYKAVKPSRSIEWGLGTGVSAVALGKARQMLGLSGKHVALDPFQKKLSDDQGLKCLAEFLALDCVEFHPVTSEEYLIQTRMRSESFDFIFIDGAHDVGHKLMDACLASGVISQNAVICFHDSFFTSTSLALIYLVEEHGMKLVETGAESKLRRRLRGIKHARRLGTKFAFNYAPQIDFSLSCLMKGG
jgi:predicted O-methyltransferase YrrM